MGIKEDLAAAKAHVADRVKTPAIPCVVNGVVHELVFYRAEPEQWSLVTSINPPRQYEGPDGEPHFVALDRRNGYNVAGVARAISATCGRVLQDGEEVELSTEEWADLWRLLPPSTARTVEANVWSLHEHDTEQEIARAKKASQRRSRKNSS